MPEDRDLGGHIGTTGGKDEDHREITMGGKEEGRAHN